MSSKKFSKARATRFQKYEDKFKDKLAIRYPSNTVVWRGDERFMDYDAPNLDEYTGDDDKWYYAYALNDYVIGDGAHSADEYKYESFPRQNAMFNTVRRTAVAYVEYKRRSYSSSDFGGRSRLTNLAIDCKKLDNLLIDYNKTKVQHFLVFEMSDDVLYGIMITNKAAPQLMREKKLLTDVETGESSENYFLPWGYVARLDGTLPFTNYFEPNGTPIHLGREELGDADIDALRTKRPQEYYDNKREEDKAARIKKANAGTLRGFIVKAKPVKPAPVENVIEMLPEKPTVTSHPELASHIGIGETVAGTASKIHHQSTIVNPPPKQEMPTPKVAGEIIEINGKRYKAVQKPTGLVWISMLKTTKSSE